jgi:hypothetical protein
MSNALKNKYQNTFSKWLLAAVLLLSFFTFSGLAVQRQAKQDAQQTTLIVSKSTRIVKSISFNGAFRHCYAQYKTTTWLVAPFLNLVNQHNRQISIKIKNHSGSNSPVIQTCFFYRVKAVSQNTGDAPILPLG